MKKAHTIILLVLAHGLLQADNVDILGNLGVSDNPETPAIEGNLTVENNVTINGELKVFKISSLPNNSPFAIQLDGIVDHYKTGIAMGPNSRVTSSYSLAIGDTAYAGGNYAFALGLNAKTTQPASAALGANTKTMAPNSVAMGAGSTTEAEASLAAGLNSKTQGRASTSLGYATVAESFSQVTVGRLNEVQADASKTEWVETDPLFVVGNGDGNKRSNAMVVLKNGDVIVSGIIRCTKTSKALPSGEFGSDEDNAGTAAETRTNESALNSDTGDGTPNQTDSE